MRTQTVHCYSSSRFLCLHLLRNITRILHHPVTKPRKKNLSVFDGRTENKVLNYKTGARQIKTGRTVIGKNKTGKLLMPSLMP